MARLFTPVSFGPLALANRIVVAPMCQYASTDGLANDWHVQHWGTLSQSGAGLLLTEATAVVPEGRISWADLGLYDDACEAAFAQALAGHGHRQQAVGAGQLGVIEAMAQGLPQQPAQ